MAQKRLLKEGGGRTEINMTPLIDVSLVLVVILLLATPLAFESAIAVRGQSDTGRAAETKTKEERVELFVVSDDVVEVNHRPVARAELGPTLRPLLSASSGQVAVACVDTVSHGAFVNVLDQAKLSGAVEIGVVSR
jgi:biopolymer transport protein ExbD